MRRWLYRIRLRDVFDEDESGYDSERELELIPQIGFLMGKRLEKLAPPFNTLLRPFVARFKTVKTEAAFNRVLDDLYNTADREHIWIE